jgi:hypothetical protein
VRRAPRGGGVEEGSCVGSSRRWDGKGTGRRRRGPRRWAIASHRAEPRRRRRAPCRARGPALPAARAPWLRHRLRSEGSRTAAPVRRSAAPLWWSRTAPLHHGQKRARAAAPSRKGGRATVCGRGPAPPVLPSGCGRTAGLGLPPHRPGVRGDAPPRAGCDAGYRAASQLEEDAAASTASCRRSRRKYPRAPRRAVGRGGEAGPAARGEDKREAGSSRGAAGGCRGGVAAQGRRPAEKSKQNSVGRCSGKMDLGVPWRRVGRPRREATAPNAVVDERPQARGICARTRCCRRPLRVRLTVGNRPVYRGNRPYRPGPVTVLAGYQLLGLGNFEFEFQNLKIVEKIPKNTS